MLSLKMMRKTRKLVSTVLNSCQRKVILGYFSVCLRGFLCGLGFAVCCEISSRGSFAGTSEEICSSKINLWKEKKSAKCCNACYALEGPGCHRPLTFILNVSYTVVTFGGLWRGGLTLSFWSYTYCSTSMYSVIAAAASEPEANKWDSSLISRRLH